MDMFWYPAETVQAAAQRRPARRDRRHILRPARRHRPSTSTGRIAAAERFFDEFGGADDVLPSIMPHGAYTVVARRI